METKMKKATKWDASEYLAIKEEWFSDNLDHLDDENIYRKLQNHWIIEMKTWQPTSMLPWNMVILQ